MDINFVIFSKFLGEGSLNISKSENMKLMSNYLLNNMAFRYSSITYNRCAQLENGSDQLFVYRGIDRLCIQSQSADPNHS